ncbi:MAG: lasso peptide biosynthesis B2 protein [Bacteroidaceae bacterium]|nr:lasso peptide biosynthesis B2 protein [Bacteroidaceae bacterium]
MAVKLLKKRPIGEYWLFLESWCFLAIARILIFWIPFRKLLPLLGRQVSQEDAEMAASAPTASNELLERIRISILRASRRSPWRTKCFEQALSVRMMLRRRNIKSVIYFGVSINQPDQPEKMTAHAWLKCSGIVVTGGKNNGSFTVVGRFLV